VPDPKKSSCWLKRKYFEQHGGRNWVFFGESCDNESKPHRVRLLLASSTPIQRHIKVKSTANPYDPVDEPYFEKREADHMAETFRGTRTLRFLWKFQGGSCPVCNTKITRITGWLSSIIRKRIFLNICRITAFELPVSSQTG
jgi:RNA-directed DNA polymerase